MRISDWSSYVCSSVLRQRAADVVVVIFDRFGHRFADRLQPCEVDDRLDAMVGDRRAHRLAVAYVADDERDRPAGDRLQPLDDLRTAVRQIVEADDLVPTQGERDRAMAAPQPGPAAQ